MPLYRDEAVVLRTQKLGEADRIVTPADPPPRPGPGGGQRGTPYRVEVRCPGSSRSCTSTCSSTKAARSTSSPRSRRSRRTVQRIADDYAPLHRRHRDLETAERMTAEEREPARSGCTCWSWARCARSRTARTTRRWCSTRSCCGRWRRRLRARARGVRGLRHSRPAPRFGVAGGRPGLQRAAARRVAATVSPAALPCSPRC